MSAHNSKVLTQTDDEVAQALNDDFLRQFGPILSSEVLIKVLGYRSAGAYRQAIARDTVPVALFQIPNRRGRFALARDVANWLSRQRHHATTRDSAQQDADEPHEGGRHPQVDEQRRAMP